MPNRFTFSTRGRGLALLLALAGTLAWSGCDGSGAAAFEPELVVESYQAVGEALRPVRVARTVEVDATYDVTATAVRGAEVRIDRLDDDGGVDATYRFVELQSEPGLYVAEQGDLVAPLRRYRLSVTVPATGEALDAETFTPGTFDRLSTNADTVVYQSAEQFAVDVSRPAYPGRQAIFVFSTEALDPDPANLTPFYRAVLEDDETGEIEIGDVIVNESPPLNETNYDANADGSLTIRLPWLAVAFYGPHRIVANAVDDNLFDFIRSQNVQQGGSTLSPGEIPNVIDRVDGGRGVFGSFVRATGFVYIARP